MRPLAQLLSRVLVLALFLPAPAHAFSTPGQPMTSDLMWGSTGSGTGQFNAPYGVAVSGTNVYVADQVNQRVQQFSTDGVFIRAWGSSGTGDGQFKFPQGVAVDPAGNVYVVDTNNNRVQKFTSTGVFITKWGATGTGDGQFKQPAGIVVDAANNVYVVDRVNNRIQKFTDTGAFLAKWGSWGVGEGQFSLPFGVCTDPAGNIYVTDHGNNRVQKFTGAGVFLTEWGSLGTYEGLFINPTGIARDNQAFMYVVDSDNRIQKFTDDGGFLVQWGSTGAGPEQLNGPLGITCDGARLFVAEGINNRVHRFSYQPIAITVTATAITVSGSFEAADDLTVVEVGPGSIQFQSRGRAFVINGSTETVNESDPIPLSGITSISINLGNGANSVLFGGFGFALPSLAVLCGTGDDEVTFMGSISLLPNANLSVDLGDLANCSLGDVVVQAGVAIQVAGTGTVQIQCGRRVSLAAGASLETANGDLTVEANRQAGGTGLGNFAGVDVAGAIIRSTGSGKVTLRGRGGVDNAGSQCGVLVRDGGSIIATGGDLVVDGIGGTSAGMNDDGVRLISGAIQANGGGTTTVTGRGGAGAMSGHDGVHVLSGGAILGGGGLTSVDGTGSSGGGTGSDGVSVEGGTIGSTGSAVTVLGATNANAGPGSVAIDVAATPSAITTAAGGILTLLGNSIRIAPTSGPVSAGAAGTVNVRAPSSGVAIDLGATSDPLTGSLNLSGPELTRIAAGTLNIGDAGSGTVTVSAAVSPTPTSAMTVTCGADITLQQRLDVGAATLLLSAGGVGRVRPEASGNDVVSGGLTLVGRLSIVINGTTVDAQYTRLAAAGPINLNSAELLISGSYGPVPGNVFAIVSNGAAATTGTFLGAPEGTTYQGFMGTGHTATLSYVTGPDADAGLTITTPFVDDAGLSGADAGSATWADYDNDGDLDVLVTGKSGPGAPSAILYRNTAGTFTDAGAGLPGVYTSAVAWGDYDNDDDLDLLLTGRNSAGSQVSRIYRNTAGAFTDIGAGLAAVSAGAVAWADYDDDGDLDVMITGRSDSQGAGITRLYRNDAGVFNQQAFSLSNVQNSSVAWADYDNDGNLDVLIAGSLSGTRSTNLYRNTGTSFVLVSAGLLGVDACSASWGDYDNDGDPDLLVAGWAGSLSTRVYRNDNGSFLNIGASLAAVDSCSVAWADFDNDGDLDIALAGRGASGAVAKIYRNAGSPGFGLAELPTAITPVQSSSAAWGDMDNDTDLDLLIAGRASIGRLASIYRTSGTPNSPPAAPTGLTAQAASTGVVLNWGASSDAITPALALTYNLRIGSSPGVVDVVSPMSASSGLRRIPAAGRVNRNRSWQLEVSTRFHNNPRWSVQAIDGAFSGSAFAVEQTIPLVGPTTSLVDVPADEGGWLYLTFTASLLDVMGLPTPVQLYGIWRRVPEAPAEAQQRQTGSTVAPIAAGEGLAAAIPAGLPTREVNGSVCVTGRGPGVTDEVAAGFPPGTWALVTYVPALQQAQYLVAVPTISDLAPSDFLVTASTTTPSIWFAGEPATGQSVDNLAPASPAAFSGSYATGSVHLTWTANEELDVVGYRLYRGAAADFAPGPVNLVADVDGTSYDDAVAGSGSYYKLSAMDKNGNESPFSLTQAGAGEELLVFALDHVRPNPTRGDHLIVVFSLPAAQAASLELVDVSGRRLARHEVGSMGTGRHSLDLARDRHLPAGLYWVRLTQGKDRKTLRVAVID